MCVVRTLRLVVRATPLRFVSCRFQYNYYAQNELSLYRPKMQPPESVTIEQHHRSLLVCIYRYARDLFLYAMRHGFLWVVYVCSANEGYGCAAQGLTIGSTWLIGFMYYVHRECYFVHCQETPSNYSHLAIRL